VLKFVLAGPAILACVLISLFVIALSLGGFQRCRWYVVLFCFVFGWNAGIISLFFLKSPTAALIIFKILHVFVVLTIGAAFQTLSLGENRARYRYERILMSLISVPLAIAFTFSATNMIQGIRRVTYWGGVDHYYGIDGSHYYVITLYTALFLVFVAYRFLGRASSYSYREIIYKRYLYAWTGFAAIFRRAFIGDDTNPPLGSGLGLSIVKKAVDLSGGTITAESTRGTGTTSRIGIPVRYVRKGAHPGTTPAQGT
jgi:hypothetical protein